MAVAVVDPSLEGAESVDSEISDKGGKALAVMADVCDAQALDTAVETALDEWSGLHLAVNNAGVPAPYSPLDDVSIEDWNRVICINLTGTFLCLRSELPVIRASGGGVIVNLSSIWG